MKTVIAGTCVAVLSLVGCSDPYPSHASTPLSGVAATGRPAANSRVTIKDASGATRETTTDAGGGYTVDVDGLEAPFIIKVDVAATGSSLYALAPDPASIQSRVNVHPYTDLIADTFYAAKGTTKAAAFQGGGPSPTPEEVEVIHETVRTMIHRSLVAHGIDPTSFDLHHSSFTPDGTGFDAVLDTTSFVGTQVVIQDATSTQTSSVTGAGANVTVGTSTTAGSATTESADGTVLPDSDTSRVNYGRVKKLLESLSDVVTARGDSLSDSDLTFAIGPGFFHDGKDGPTFAAFLATYLRGSTVRLRPVRLISKDDVNQVYDLAFEAVVTVQGETQIWRLRMTFQNVAGTVFMIGNHRAQIWSTVRIATSVSAAGTVTMQNQVQPEVQDAQGLLAGVSVSDQTGLFTNANLPKQAQAFTSVFEPTPTKTLDFVEDDFSASLTPAALPAPGTTFTYTLVPVSGATQTVTDTATGTAGEPVALTAPVVSSSHVLASIVATTQTIAWTLPETYATFDVGVSISITDGTTRIFLNPAAPVGNTSTQATFSVPAVMPGGNAITGAVLDLHFTGPNGESSSLSLNYQ